jgi:hypothetical protein
MTNSGKQDFYLQNSQGVNVSCVEVVFSKSEKTADYQWRIILQLSSTAYTNFERKEALKDQYCYTIRADQSYAGQWSAKLCTDANPFVCYHQGDAISEFSFLF